MQDGCTWNTFSFKSNNIGNDVAIELAVELIQPAHDEIHTVLIICHGKGECNKNFEKTRTSTN